MTEAAEHQTWVDAVRRSWPAYSDEIGFVTTSATEAGTMICAYRRAKPRAIARVYVDARSGTVYDVPDYVSYAEAMQEAVADPIQRARMEVL